MFLPSCTKPITDSLQGPFARRFGTRDCGFGRRGGGGEEEEEGERKKRRGKNPYLSPPKRYIRLGAIFWLWKWSWS